MPVHRVASGEPQRHPAGLNAEMCENGAEWQWDNVRFRLWHWQAAGDSNQRSCVLLVEANGEKVLLTGDIDQAAADVQAAIARTLRQLPANMTTPPSYRKVNPADAPILLVALQSDSMSLSQLDDFAEDVAGEQAVFDC